MSYILPFVLAIFVLFPTIKETASAETLDVEKPKQSISEPGPEDEKRLEEQRAVISAYLANEQSREKFKIAEGKLKLIDILLQRGVFSPAQTYKLQCLGVVLGDAFALELGMHWVMVEDEYGRDPALRLGDSSIIIFPLTMISKRVENGEAVDIHQLYEGVARTVRELKDTAD